MTKSTVLTCAHSRRVVAAPVVVEPVVAPVPPVVVPVQVTDVEVAVRVAVVYRVPSVSPPLVVQANELGIEYYPAYIMP